mgnify:CR=1 FL=1
MDLLNGMLQKDQDEFRRICNKLMYVLYADRIRQQEVTSILYKSTKKSLKNYLEYSATD